MANWISGAIKHPGALTKKAKKAGEVKKDGDIDKSWIDKKAKGSGTTAKQARFAKVLAGIRKGK